MNKSLAFKKKFYLFISLVISFLLFLYLMHFLINGPRGIISYFTLKNKQKDYYSEIFQLREQNDHLLNKIARLQTNTIDLDFLDEQLREKTGLLLDNEIIISFND